MEWMEALRASIDYMEANLMHEISAGDVAAAVHLSPFYYQRGFKLVTGYSVKEYLRSRRLYLAALELAGGEKKVIDLAYRYGFETPESFSKAFTRFHGFTPAQTRKCAANIRPFLPLKIQLTVQGGNDMDFTVEKMEPLTMIGFARRFRGETSYQEIPAFWDEYCRKCSGGGFSRETAAVLERCMVGEFGVCMDDDPGNGSFMYLIAGRYDGGPVPEGMQVHTLPALSWARFRCTGPLPGALQTINTRIFREWLPGNPRYEMADSFNIEWYGQGDTQAVDYVSEIWMPVREKQQG